MNLPWVVRFEDIDQPRVVAGAQQRQLDEMRELGLIPNQILLQSAAAKRHWQIFVESLKSSKVYPCFCSRKDVREALEGAASAPHQKTALYNGRCRDLKEYPKTDLPTVAWRYRDARGSGEQDFIIARSAPVKKRGELPELNSFVPAYNWACAIDDADGRYALLVRASDLAGVVEQQRQIQKLAGSSEAEYPAVFHTSLVVQNDGTRLEKRTKGVTLHELKAQGFNAQKLAGLFESSFHAKPSDFEPHKIFGEPNETLSIGRLFGDAGEA